MRQRQIEDGDCWNPHSSSGHRSPAPPLNPAPPLWRFRSAGSCGHSHSNPVQARFCWQVSHFCHGVPCLDAAASHFPAAHKTSRIEWAAWVLARNSLTLARWAMLSCIHNRQDQPIFFRNNDNFLGWLLSSAPSFNVGQSRVGRDDFFFSVSWGAP